MDHKISGRIYAMENELADLRVICGGEKRSFNLQCLLGAVRVLVKEKFNPIFFKDVEAALKAVEETTPRDASGREGTNG